MTRTPTLAAATLAAFGFGLYGTAPAGASVLALPLRAASAESAAEGADATLVHRRRHRDECAADASVVPVGVELVWRRRFVNDEGCAGAEPALPAHRRRHRDECAAETVMQVGVELVWRRRYVSDAECAEAAPLVPTGFRRRI